MLEISQWVKCRSKTSLWRLISWCSRVSEKRVKFGQDFSRILLNPTQTVEVGCISCIARWFHTYFSWVDFYPHAEFIFPLGLTPAPAEMLTRLTFTWLKPVIPLNACWFAFTLPHSQQTKAQQFIFLTGFTASFLPLIYFYFFVLPTPFLI